MKRIILSSMVLALAIPGLTLAAVVNPIIDFDEGYAAEGARANGDQTSNVGDVLTIIGFVEAFNEPFDDLDPNDPTKEYTFVYSDLVSTGTVATPLGPFTQWSTDYTGGTIRVYCDVAMDADYANPATFANGDMILEGTFSSFTIETDNTDSFLGCSGNVGGAVTFTGGSLSARLDTACEGAIVGQFSVCSVTYNPPAGFTGFGSGQTKLDANCPVPVENKTWGAIKSLYQD